jgi:hypothetical protein
MPFEMVSLLCVGSVVYWSVWVFDSFQGVEGRGGGGWGLGFLWAVGFQKGVKNYIGKYEVVVIEVVVGYVFDMDVKPFDRV